MVGLVAQISKGASNSGGMPEVPAISHFSKCHTYTHFFLRIEQEKAQRAARVAALEVEEQKRKQKVQATNSLRCTESCMCGWVSS